LQPTPVNPDRVRHRAVRVTASCTPWLHGGTFAPQKCTNCPGELTSARMCTPSEVLPMSEVIPLPTKPPSKSIEEETAEFLALLQRIRSQSQKSK
jgi:hypothetical protein